MTNFQILTTHYHGVSGARVHSGFHKAYTSIQDEVKAAVNHLLISHPKAHLLVTGHSLGGALATLAALDMRKHFPALKVTLYTFGQPRVGNPEFSNYVFSQLPQSYIRVVNYDDAVAHIPHRVQGYKHAGNEVWYKHKNFNG